MPNEPRAEQGGVISRHIEARQVEIGDTIRWCGYWCEVTGIEMAGAHGSGTQKPGRRFSILGPDPVGEKSGLHWFYNEPVEILEGEVWTDGTY